MAKALAEDSADPVPEISPRLNIRRRGNFIEMQRSCTSFPVTRKKKGGTEKATLTSRRNGEGVFRPAATFQTGRVTTAMGNFPKGTLFVRGHLVRHSLSKFAEFPAAMTPARKLLAIFSDVLTSVFFDPYVHGHGISSERLFSLPNFQGSLYEFSRTSATSRPSFSRRIIHVRNLCAKNVNAPCFQGRISQSGTHVCPKGLVKFDGKRITSLFSLTSN